MSSTYNAAFVQRWKQSRASGMTIGDFRANLRRVLLEHERNVEQGRKEKASQTKSVNVGDRSSKGKNGTGTSQGRDGEVQISEPATIREVALASRESLDIPPSDPVPAPNDIAGATIPAIAPDTQVTENPSPSTLHNLGEIREKILKTLLRKANERASKAESDLAGARKAHERRLADSSKKYEARLSSLRNLLKYPPRPAVNEQAIQTDPPPEHVRRHDVSLVDRAVDATTDTTWKLIDKEVQVNHAEAHVGTKATPTEEIGIQVESRSGSSSEIGVQVEPKMGLRSELGVQAEDWPSLRIPDLGRRSGQSHDEEGSSQLRVRRDIGGFLSSPGAARSTTRRISSTTKKRVPCLRECTASDIRFADTGRPSHSLARLLTLPTKDIDDVHVKVADLDLGIRTPPCSGSTAKMETRTQQLVRMSSPIGVPDHLLHVDLGARARSGARGRGGRIKKRKLSFEDDGAHDLLDPDLVSDAPTRREEKMEARRRVSKRVKKRSLTFEDDETDEEEDGMMRAQGGSVREPAGEGGIGVGHLPAFCPAKTGFEVQGFAGGLGRKGRCSTRVRKRVLSFGDSDDS